MRILLLDCCKKNSLKLGEMLSSEFSLQMDHLACIEKLTNYAFQQRYDIYLIHISVIDQVGLEFISAIHRNHTKAKVFVLLTDHTYDMDMYFNDLIESGVSGFIRQTSSKKQFIHAIRCATEELVIIPTKVLAKLRRIDQKIKIEGKNEPISEKERHILLLAAKGMTNGEIAEEIHMSQRNVERYLTTLYKKMRVHTRFEAINLGKELGLIPKYLIANGPKQKKLPKLYKLSIGLKVTKNGSRESM